MNKFGYLEEDIPGRLKKRTKHSFTMLVVWQLLSGFCLIHPMLCDCDIKEKALLLLRKKKDSAER